MQRWYQETGLVACAPVGGQLGGVEKETPTDFMPMEANETGQVICEGNPMLPWSLLLVGRLVHLLLRRRANKKAEPKLRGVLLENK